jgi:hypothetical protein
MRPKIGLAPDGAPQARPLDDVVKEIATLARISDPAARAYFCEGVLLLIEEIRQAPVVERWQRSKSDEVASQLSAVERKAIVLCEELDRMSRDVGAPGVAGRFLRAAARDQRLAIPTVISNLEILATVAKAAASDVQMRHDRTKSARVGRSKKQSAAGRPKGTRGNVRFDLFIDQLLCEVRSMGGKKLTIYKSEAAEEGWDGTLLKAIRLLEPYLPPQFFPTSALGRVLNRIVHG